MKLLPSFNGKERRTREEILTSLGYLITDVKRLTTFDPNFFLLVRGGAFRLNRKANTYIHLQTFGFECD